MGCAGCGSGKPPCWLCGLSVIPLLPRWAFLERSIWAGPWQAAGISCLGRAGVPWEEVKVA